MKNKLLMLGLLSLLVGCGGSNASSNKASSSSVACCDFRNSSCNFAKAFVSFFFLFFYSNNAFSSS